MARRRCRRRCARAHGSPTADGGSRSRCRCRACFPACRAVPVRRRASARALRAPSGPASAAGQATVELVAALPALLLAGYVAFQLLAAGYALTLADGAAEAGALALASGARRPRRLATPCPAGRRTTSRSAFGAAGSRCACGRRRSRRRSPSVSPSPAAPLRGRDDGGRAALRADAAIAVSRVGEAEGSRAIAAALACAGSDPDRAALLVELDRRPRAPRPALVASAAARALEERLAVSLPEAAVASRGALCHLTLPAGARGPERAPAALALVRDSLGVVLLPPALLQAALEPAGLRAGAVVLRADLGRDRALTALAVRDLIARGVARRGRQAAAGLGRRRGGRCSGRCPPAHPAACRRGCSRLAWARPARELAPRERARRCRWRSAAASS